MIEKTIELGFLFDFYGKLLSKRQYSIIEMFYIHDLSLTEIGLEIDISRQAVYDTLKRGEEKLYNYEIALGLVEKFKNREENIQEISNISKDIEKITRDIMDTNKKSDNKNIDDIKYYKDSTLNIILIKAQMIKNAASHILENNEEGSD